MAELADRLDVAAVLGEGGIIGEQVADFVPRASQLGMAELIAEAIRLGESQLIEAATGIGKSFAYLTPALLADAHVVISTGTRNLQDQLFARDIPLLRRAIVAPKQVALLKGRSNYCCLHRLARFRGQPRFARGAEGRALAAVADWAALSDSGDIAEFAALPEGDSLWYYATSNADNCLGGECPEIERCFVLKARRRAMAADLLVINHHLYFSDLRLKADGFGEILPEADVMIFDEAHQLPEIAAHFYGEQLTLRQLETLCRDAADAEAAEAPESDILKRRGDRAAGRAVDLLLALRAFAERGEWAHIRHAPAIVTALDALGAALAALAEALDPLAGRGKEIAACERRLAAWRDALGRYLDEGENHVAWYEWSERGFRLALSPLDLSGTFREQLDRAGFGTAIFTSATLTTQQSFRYFSERLGLADYRCSRFDSPFDYAAQALLYLPAALPDPADEAYPRRFGELCRELVEVNDGHCFILFTSYRMLRLTAGYLREHGRHPLLVQGELQRGELLARFVAEPGPVLLGTSSFWEGVDVKGSQLRCVIIDKLPFRSPQDPVYRRRLQRVREAGGNPFVEVQLPEATIALRQGVGRLIRDAADRGIVVLADNRLSRKAYGKGMLDSLPPLRLTRDFDEVRAFAAAMAAADEADARG